MALNFPASPVDGEVYPDPAPPGTTQYVYNSDKGTWLTVFRGVERVGANNPLYMSGTPSNPEVNIYAASATRDGYMSSEDKIKLDGLNPGTGTVTSVTAGAGLGAPQTGDSITTSGTISLLPPTPLAIGGIKAGSNVNIATDGTLSLKPPSSVEIGGVKAGSGVDISPDGTISAAPSFTALDNIESQFNGSQLSFQMTIQGRPFTPSSISNLLVFVGGVVQPPGGSFTTSGSTLIFTSAPPAGTSFYGISIT